ncbi:uncharacterized protein HKW66_Vig0237030 [Vigna angularis]|uniref:CST complex subunit CTC1 n=1 Tax=Phaseolus angularis TaxID=3914 RepID=A0A8T0KS22_PHAAN|nr:uncharacterized protein HKW66_Vig0237030 [Vigna angularis]
MFLLNGTGENSCYLRPETLLLLRSVFLLLPPLRSVNIYGSVNKHTFPTGFGPGVTAVFHRILYARPSILSSTKDADDASREYISCLISELPQGLTHKKIVLRCKVVAVLVLVIERNTPNFIAETKVNAQGTLLDIPLACFLLEDQNTTQLKYGLWASWFLVCGLAHHTLCFFDVSSSHSPLCGRRSYTS